MYKRQGLVRSLTSPVTVYQNGKAADTTATLSYTYDSDNYNLLSLSGTGSAGAVTNTYAYNDAKGLLTAINHNGFSYTFGYDSWDRRTTTSAGGQVLATNTDVYKRQALMSSSWGLACRPSTTTKLSSPP